jgi:superfamily II DNA or RNA helicase
MLDTKRDAIQNTAVDTWDKLHRKGTVNLSTGIGKTFVFLKACKLLPKGSKILFLAETTQREFDLNKDIAFFKKVFKWDLHAHHNLTFACYQTACKWSNTQWDLVCADEIHSSLTPIYSLFYKQNKYNYILGLSATIDRNTSYIVNGEEINKGILIDSIAPVIFKYSLNQAISDGTTKKLRIYYIQHKLDSINRNVEAGTKDKRFKTTEKDAYDYWDNQFKQALFLPDGDKKLFRIRNTSAARAKILYNLDSKIEALKKLIPVLKGKTLLFGNSIETLLKVTPHVISNKNTETKNLELREKFDKGKINIIGSFKMLKQGANLKSLDNTVLMSYYSKELDMIQALGRQRVSDSTGNVFIFVTTGTQEVKWSKKALQNITNYEEIHCKDIDECIEKYQFNETFSESIEQKEKEENVS